MTIASDKDNRPQNFSSTEVKKRLDKMRMRRRLITAAWMVGTPIVFVWFFLWGTGDKGNVLPSATKVTRTVLAKKTPDDEAYEAAEKAGTRAAWLDYLTRFPSGHYTAEALQFIRHIEEKEGICVYGKILKINSPIANVSYRAESNGATGTANVNGGEIVTATGPGIVPGDCDVKHKAAGGIVSVSIPISKLQFSDTPTEAELRLKHKFIKGTPAIVAARMRELLTEKAAELGENPASFQKEMEYIEAHVKKCTSFTSTELAAAQTPYGLNWRQMGDKGVCWVNPGAVTKSLREMKPGERGIWYEVMLDDDDIKQGIYRIRVMFTYRDVDPKTGNGPFTNHGIIAATVTRE